MNSKPYEQITLTCAHLTKLHHSHILVSLSKGVDEMKKTRKLMLAEQQDEVLNGSMSIEMI